MDFCTIIESDKSNNDKLFSCIRGAGHYDNLSHEDKKEGSQSYQWIYCCNGEGELQINDITYTIREKQGIFIYPNVPYVYYTTKNPWETYWVSMDGKQPLCSFLKHIGLSRSEVLSVRNSEIILSNMNKICEIASIESPYRDIECSCLIYGLLINLYKYAHISNDPCKINSETRQKYLKKLNLVFEYIDNNYYKVITIDELANILEVTPQYISHLFRNATGLRPLEYVNKVKIGRAKDIMLLNPLMKVKQVSESIGFDNLSHFYWIFKKLEGMSPGTFRKTYYGSSQGNE